MTPDAETLSAEFRSDGISVEQVAVDDGIALEYMTAFPADRVHDGEIGRACNTLIDLIEAGECEPTDVEATVVRSPGDVLGTWRADAEWFERLTSYEISETEFSARVLGTVRHESDAAGDGTDANDGADASEATTGSDASDEAEDP